VESHLATVVAFGGGTSIALVGLLGMRILAGAAVTGEWPRGASDWVRYLFIWGPVRIRRLLVFAILWFLACGFLAFALIAGVLIAARSSSGG
jgi:hypothetical protein